MFSPDLLIELQSPYNRENKWDKCMLIKIRVKEQKILSHVFNYWYCGSSYFESLHFQHL
jgi:hypothetical protein